MTTYRLSLPILSLFLLLLASCQSEATENEGQKSSTLEGPMLELLSPAQSGVDFANTLSETPNMNIAFYDYYYNGAGVAAGDIDNDGLPDLFFAGNNVPNKLYRNLGKFKFEDISAKAGINKTNPWSVGVTMADVNNDGWLDIYVCNSGPSDPKAFPKANQLFINQQDGTFKEMAAEYGVADPGYSMSCTFLDYDKDGDMDLFVLNHSNIYETNTYTYHDWLAKASKEELKLYSNTLYRNNGNGSFTDVSEEAGVLKPGFGLGIIAADFNNDGWTDLYVSNDYFIPDFLYINQGDGTFKDAITAHTAHTSFYSMGCDAADINNDGLLDLGAVDMTPADHVRSKVLMPSMDVPQFHYLINNRGYQLQYMFNSLQANRGYGIFSEIGNYSGVSKTDWSWTALFVDMDNDGLKDYIVTNGFKRDTKDNDFRLASQKARQEGKPLTPEQVWENLNQMESHPLPNYLYHNKGEFKFENVAEDWGFAEPSFSNGTAYADFDLDGDLDLAINNVDAPAFIYRNKANETGNHFLRVQLKSSSHRSIFNSKIEIYYPEGKQYYEITPSRGYASCSETIAHFGLGSTDQVEKVRIIWPDGNTQTVIENPAIDKVLVVDMDKSPHQAFAKSKKKHPFIDITSQSGIDFVHRENPYNDYAKEVLLPHSQSRLGPFIAVGDVNGDGFQDFFVGGAKGQSGKLYLQDPGTGKFVAAPSQPWQQHQQMEDMGCLFFDADGDGDQDLYVASGGGGDVQGKKQLLQDRLYLNDGQGQFSYAAGKLPRITISSGRVKARDFDGDGDQDLLVCGRTMPGKYPSPVSSLLLENTGGKFIDATDKRAPDLKDIGMITDAVWSDFSGDGKPDLILTGEWMEITFLENRDGKFVKPTKDLLPENTTGWWYSIAAADVDGDGDTDYILGNVGENNKFHPTEEHPLHLFFNDFDENGTGDIVLSKAYHEKLVPVRGKECSTAQMPFVSEKFPTFRGFANATLQDIYGEEKLEKSLHYTARTFSSYWMERREDGTFRLHRLPYAAQWSPVNAMVVTDLDKDGRQDIVLGGNMFQAEVETPAYDAGKGLWMEMQPDGKWVAPINMEETGLYLPHDLKDLQLIYITPQKLPALLVANNNNLVQLVAFIKQ